MLLEDAGARNFMVNAGGNLAVRGCSAGGRPWRSALAVGLTWRREQPGGHRGYAINQDGTPTSSLLPEDELAD